MWLSTTLLIVTNAGISLTAQGTCGNVTVRLKIVDHKHLLSFSSQAHLSQLDLI